ncbi:hypothetical protein BB559_003502 [Furculomyces boomerangus]|uniref:Survival factor 1 n=2 Tax=Harpellales TaxID=61421 RepID=A0A2T9YFI8_9FUNG|nr:hypothetical protein BB559_005303 [Furculomyces boomerangus]PVU91100.1 hypothetical protein BB559_004303 [Furculomyces boomerangus]PVU93014.1 hypothetical protein BB559_003502 [Furculomyces boomerangus]PVZ98926.1 hypothetical protein BB558_005064 [Smittium angustum]PWA02109.1 hypothetical protein BB558_001768 [Smittium angustum]
MFWGSYKTKTALSGIKPGDPIISKITAHDLEWKCSGTGSETHSIYFRLDNGYFGFIQFAWAKVSLSTTYQTNFFIYAPGKPTIFETLNENAMQIGKDNVSVSSNSLKLQWSHDMKEIIAIYNNGKSAPHEAINLLLTFKINSEGYKIGEGVNDIAGGTAMHAFYPRGAVTSQLSVHGEPNVSSSGVGIFIRAISTGILPYNVGEEWFLAVAAGKSQDEDFFFHTLHYTTPQKYGGTVITQGAILRSGKPTVYFWDNTIEQKEFSKDNTEHYELPSNNIFTMRGETETGKKAELIFNSRPDKFLYEIDVLGQLNRIVKSVVQTLVTNPLVFESYETKATFVLKVDGEPDQILNGECFHELSLIK